MGLDMYAYSREQGEPKPEGGTPEQYYWRKHSKLQNFMEEKWMAKTGNSRRELNCNELPLNQDDITELEDRVRKGKLKKCKDGFFYELDYQDEQAKEYKTQDLEFCEWALDEIKDGRVVYFRCWW